MAVIFAHFQSSGNSPVLIEVSKILAKGVHSDMLTSFSTRGCIPSGSGDFEMFNLSSFFLTNNKTESTNSDKEKTNILADFFTSVFTFEGDGEMPDIEKVDVPPLKNHDYYKRQS
jgi:hypothetical protein